MIDIFISLGIPFLLFELTVSIFSERYYNYTQSLLTEIKSGYISKSNRPFLQFQLVYMLWVIIGLFTNVWGYFLALFVLSILSHLINKRLVTDSSKIKQKRADSILSVLIIFELISTYF